MGGVGEMREVGAAREDRPRRNIPALTTCRHELRRLPADRVLDLTNPRRVKRLAIGSRPFGQSNESPGKR